MITFGSSIGKTFTEKESINESKSEMIKGKDGFSSYQFLDEKFEQKSRYTYRTEEITTPPRRGTEIPGWYKQMYSEMGNPQSITPILIKRCHNNSSSGGIAVNSPEIGRFEFLDSSNFRPNTSASYETESSRSSTPGRDGSESSTRYLVEKTIPIGGVIDDDEPIDGRQEYYPYRDARHGKPLPGENGYKVEPLTNNHRNHYGMKKQFNSTAPKDGLSKQSQGRSATKYVSKSSPRFKNNSQPPRSSPLLSRSTLNRTPHPHRRSTSNPSASTKSTTKNQDQIYENLKLSPEYFSQLRHIKVKSIPVPIPPKFGTLTQGGRWPNEAQGPIDVGPPCRLCKKPITESRFIPHDKFIYHCWHFTCSHCFKTLEHDDFRIARNEKPYCNNCFKRQYP